MHTLKSTRAMSKLSLLILLLTSGTIGAVLSYLWTVGYFTEMGYRVPEGVTTITITNVTFPIENADYFNVTVMNPTYSKANASITSIALITPTDDVKMVDSVEPSIPYPLAKGETVTFKCNSNWGEYTGQHVTVAVFVEDGSGATTSYHTQLVKLEIAEFSHNTSITISQFNITVQNPSIIPLDISKILLETEEIPSEDIFVDGQNITFPYRISENESKVFTCHFQLWDSEINTGYLGGPHDIVIKTVQGYPTTRTVVFAPPVLLTLSNVTFPQLNTTQFVLRNEPKSPHQVNLSNVTISVGNENFTVTHINATGYVLEKGSNVTILCQDEHLNWDLWKGETITIRAYTTQGFFAVKEETLPSG